MSTPAVATSAAKWIPRAAPVSYTTIVRPQAAPLPEASSPPSIPEPQSGLTVIRELGRPIIRLQGEQFFVERDDGVYYIRHERWSLLGAGDTLSAAYKDLLQGAKEVAPVYANTPLTELDDEGFQLTRFLLRFL